MKEWIIIAVSIESPIKNVVVSIFFSIPSFPANQRYVEGNAVVPVYFCKSCTPNPTP